MNNQQRGVYQPLMENIPIYDLSEDEPEEEEEERSRLPLLIVVALLVLAAFAGVVWVAYNQGVARGRAGAIIAAPEGPVRTAPADAGGAATPFTGLKVYGEPVPPDREAQSSTLAQNQQNTLNATVARPQTAPAAPPTATTEAPPIRLNPDAPALAARPAAPAASPAARPAAPAAPPPQVAAPARSAAPPQQVASATPPAPAAQAGAPARLTTPPPLPARAPAPVAAAPAPAAAGFYLQVGSFETEEQANGGWNAFRNRFSSFAANVSENVQRADLGTRGVRYRLRVGPYADRNAAISACDTLRGQGGTCLVSAP